MTGRRTCTILAGAVAAIMLFSGISSASSLDKIRFIKIAALDEKAVIKDSDGKLRVIKAGDAITDTVTVREIAAGRIMLEEKTDKGSESLIVRIRNGKDSVERIRAQGEVRSSRLAAPAAPVKVAPGVK